jgi:hypothetical protein
MEMEVRKSCIEGIERKGNKADIAYITKAKSCNYWEIGKRN